MARLLAKVKSTFFTQSLLIDDGLFGAPDPLPSSKPLARYHPEERPHNSRPAIEVNSTRREPIRHSPSSQRLNFGNHGRYFSIPETPFRTSYDPPESFLETNYIQPTNPYAGVSGVDGYRRVFPPSGPSNWRHVSAPTTISLETLSTSARVSSQASPVSQSNFHQRGNRHVSAPNMPTLKACNICLDSHPPTEFPARPITSTCTHPIDDTCKNCLQQHLATQIASRGAAVLTCICNQPLSFDDVQRHATPADFGRYSERTSLSTVERYANFIWCPRTGCSAGQIHEAGDAAPIVTCAGCRQRYCYTHRVPWHTGITCTQYDALTPDEQVEAIERAEVSGSAILPPTRAVDRRSPQMPNYTEQAERRRRRAEERAGEKFVRASGAKACPQCGYMTQKDGGCKHMTCQKCQHQYCWICRRVWVRGHLNDNC